MTNTITFINNETKEELKYIFLKDYYEVYRNEEFMLSVAFDLYPNKSSEDIQNDLVDGYLNSNKEYQVIRSNTEED